MKINTNVIKENRLKSGVGDIIEIDNDYYLVIDYESKSRILEFHRFMLIFENNQAHKDFEAGKYKIIAKSNELEIRRIN